MKKGFEKCFYYSRDMRLKALTITQEFIMRGIGEEKSEEKPNTQGPVVREPINVNPRLKVNRGFLLLRQNFKLVVKKSQRQN